jgi:hypothetical protein
VELVTPREAIERVRLTGKSSAQVAKDLGISDVSFRGEARP